MSAEAVRAFFRARNMEHRILELDCSIATVALAAAAIGTEECRIAKSLSFRLPSGPILVVAAGDARIDNRAFKEQFGVKPTMLSHDEVEPAIGHGVGGVCPFAVKEGVTVYLDASLRRFETVFLACGSISTAIELTLPELEALSGAAGWINICKNWQDCAV